MVTEDVLLDKDDNKRRHRTFIVISAIIFLFAVLFVICIVLLILLYDNRHIGIEKYNSMISSWNSKYYSLFSEFNVYIEVNSQNYLCDAALTQNGDYWPVRDPCNELVGSGTGCTNANQLYYYANSIPITYANSLNVFYSIDNETITLLNTIIYQNKTVSIDYKTLNCENDFSLCIKNCEAIQGKWVNGVCTYTKYLSSICISLSYNETNQRWFIEPNKIQSGQYGCYYKDNKWGFRNFSGTKQNFINLLIQTEYSPEVISSFITNGCSDTTLINKQCLSQYDYSYFVTLLTLLSFSIIVLLILLSIYYIKWCQKKNDIYPRTHFAYHYFSVY